MRRRNRKREEGKTRKMKRDGSEKEEEEEEKEQEDPGSVSSERPPHPVAKLHAHRYLRGDNHRDNHPL